LPEFARTALLPLARMSVSQPSSFRRELGPIAISAVVALVYAFGHLVWYRQTPLGQVPVLDEQENLAFAEAIARGALPHAPFYRAPGYALILALLRISGVPIEGLFSAALTLGAVLHAINAGLVARIAGVYFGRVAALAAGLLCALNPVLVHYSTQALDAAPALTFFLLGLFFIAPALVENGSPTLWPWLAASAAWAAATICRPNYLAVWCTLPLLVFWRPVPRWPRIIASLAGAVLFAGVALWQWRVSGEAGFLPWQGPYNLWAANQPGTHGRYYLQHEKLPAGLADQNPARAESIFLFRQATGHAPADIRELNAYWRARFFEHVTGHPFAWCGLLARKTYALLNNWEQYNNKTFALHQSRSPWLRWNPLGFGILLVLGVAGLARLASVSRRTAGLFTAVAVTSAAGVLLFFVSARFRLPLAALATILAGGALAAPRFWQPWPRTRQVALAVALVVAVGLAYSRFDDVASRATFVEDHALLARAASTIGDDATTWSEANAALALQPAHADALRLVVAAYFNELVLRGPEPTNESRWAEHCANFLKSPADDLDGLRAVAAVALWRSQRRPEALAEWRSLQRAPSAIAARVLVADPRVSPRDLLGAPPAAWEEPLYRLAAARFKLAPPGAERAPDPKSAADVIQRIFGELPAP
jgi:4-amino-4-deoxy-L-arabinose transferase-like glycosyltransferase